MMRLLTAVRSSSPSRTERRRTPTCAGMETADAGFESQPAVLAWRDQPLLAPLHVSPERRASAFGGLPHRGLRRPVRQARPRRQALPARPPPAGCGLRRPRLGDRRSRRAAPPDAGQTRGYGKEARHGAERRAPATRRHRGEDRGRAAAAHDRGHRRDRGGDPAANSRHTPGGSRARTRRPAPGAAPSFCSPPGPKPPPASPTRARTASSRPSQPGRRSACGLRNTHCRPTL